MGRWEDTMNGTKQGQDLWPTNVRYLAECVWDDDIPDGIRRMLSGHVSTAKRALIGDRLLRSTWSKLVRIEKITDAHHPACGQFGLFATKTLEPNSFILPYVGRVHRNERSDPLSDYDIGWCENLSIDAQTCGNEARMINDFRNTGMKVNALFDDYKDPQSGQTVLGVWTGPRLINRGSEILVSYGKAYWKARGLLRDEWADYVEDSVAQDRDTDTTKPDTTPLSAVPKTGLS